MLGDFDWDRLRTVGRLPAAVWFWFFTFLMVQIMLNMLLAIIMETYMEVKGRVSHMAHVETMWSQASVTFRNWSGHRAGHLVTLKDVLTHLTGKEVVDQTDKDLERTEALSSQQLLERVPTMSLEQASEIMTQAQEILESETQAPVSISDATVKLADIDDRTLRMEASIDWLQQAVKCLAGAGEPGVFANAGPRSQLGVSLSRCLRDPGEGAAGSAAAALRAEGLLSSVEALGASQKQLRAEQRSLQGSLGELVQQVSELQQSISLATSRVGGQETNTDVSRQASSDGNFGLDKLLYSHQSSQATSARGHVKPSSATLRQTGGAPSQHHAQQVVHPTLPLSLGAHCCNLQTAIPLAAVTTSCAASS